jgi:hypothetical protein
MLDVAQEAVPLLRSLKMAIPQGIVQQCNKQSNRTWTHCWLAAIYHTNTSQVVSAASVVEKDSTCTGEESENAFPSVVRVWEAKRRSHAPEAWRLQRCMPAAQCKRVCVLPACPQNLRDKDARQVFHLVQHSVDVTSVICSEKPWGRACLARMLVCTPATAIAISTMARTESGWARACVYASFLHNTSYS